MPELTRKQKRALLTAGVGAGVYLSFKYLLPLFIPFIIAYVIALMLRPVAVWLERRLTFRICSRSVRVPVGVIGGVELVLVLAVL